MGAAASNASLLRGFGLSTSPSSVQDGSPATQWSIHVKTENTDGLGLGFGTQPMTRDLLGLGIGSGGSGGGTSTGGLSALLNSFAGDFDVASYGGQGGHDNSSPGDTWEGAAKEKSPMS